MWHEIFANGNAAHYHSIDQILFILYFIHIHVQFCFNFEIIGKNTKLYQHLIDLSSIVNCFFSFLLFLFQMHKIYNVISIFQLKFYIDEEYIGTITTVREIQLIGRGDVYLGGTPIDYTDSVVTQGYSGGITKVSLWKVITYIS